MDHGRDDVLDGLLYRLDNHLVWSVGLRVDLIGIIKIWVDLIGINKTQIGIIKI